MCWYPLSIDWIVHCFEYSFVCVHRRDAAISLAARINIWFGLIVILCSSVTFYGTPGPDLHLRCIFRTDKITRIAEIVHHFSQSLATTVRFEIYDGNFETKNLKKYINSWYSRDRAACTCRIYKTHLLSQGGEGKRFHLINPSLDNYLNMIDTDYKKSIYHGSPLLQWWENARNAHPKSDAIESSPSKQMND